MAKRRQKSALDVRIASVTRALNAGGFMEVIYIGKEWFLASDGQRKQLLFARRKGSHPQWLMFESESEWAGSGMNPKQTYVQTLEWLLQRPGGPEWLDEMLREAPDEAVEDFPGVRRIIAERGVRRANPPRSNPGGDIWDLHQGSAWVVVPTNGVINAKGNAVMGKGVAGQAAKLFPPTWVEPAYWRDPRTGTQMEREGYEDPGIAAALGERLRLAKRSYPNDPYLWNKPFRFDDYRIFTFPTKFDWRSKADLRLIEASAKQLADLIINWAPGLDRKPIYIRRRQPRLHPGGKVPFDHECPVFMPHVGAGAGGLDWAAVEPIIRKHLGSLVTIVPPPTTTPKTRAAKRAKKPTRLTKPARATKKRAATKRPVRANPPIPKTWEADAASEWVWPVIDHNWDAIHATVARFGTPDWDDVIDCGAMGCIVPFADNRRLVIKVTTDETEGAIVQRLMDTGLDQREPGLTRFQGVWRLDVPKGLVIVDPPTGFTDVAGGDTPMEVLCAFLIVREDVRPWSEEEAESYADALGRQGVIAPNADGGYTIPWLPFLEDAMEAGEQGHMDAFYDNCASLAEFPETHELARAFIAMAQKGVIIADQHLDNLGFRLYPADGVRRTLVEWLDGKRRPPLLTLDVGQSDMPGVDQDDPASCDVVTSVRRANPWVTKALRRIPPIP